ncbi:MAG: ankyrin repeat domain-containing protein [Bacteroidales bacterium]|nr:ankyrin repeat domain-containing protein [Bacteroidales bacterium]
MKMRSCACLGLAVLFLALYIHADAQETDESVWETIYDLDFQLILASDRGDSVRVNELIDFGADVNATTYQGVTPLMYASQNGHLTVVRMLISNGADPDRQSLQGTTALISAVRAGWIETAEFLIRNGADPDLPDKRMATPLMQAVAENRYYITDMLLYYGADADSRDRTGISALMLACREGKYDIAELLVNHGADVNAADERGRTVLHFATMNGNADLMDVLIASGADIEQRTGSGFSPLAVAAAENHFEAARLLIGRGADVNSRIGLALNPLSLAGQHGNHELTDMLRKNGATTSYWPYFSRFTLSAELSFSRENTELRFETGISDQKYNLNVHLGYGFWIKPMQVLEQENDDVYYQYWEKRSSVFFALSKDIVNLSHRSRMRLGLYAGLKGIYSFGSRAGSGTKADDCLVLSPGVGVRGELGMLQLKIQYEYVNLDIYKSSRNRLNFSVGLILKRKKGILDSDLKDWE